MLQARNVLRPSDPSLTDATRDLQDTRHFRLQGVPAAATMTEVARFCAEIGWRAIPQNKVVLRGVASWHLTGAEPPKENKFRWGGDLIYVVETDLEDERARRQQTLKKRSKAQVNGPHSVTTSEGSGKDARQAGVLNNIREQDQKKADPWQAQDPWSNFGAKQSSGQGGGSAPSSSTRPPPELALPKTTQVSDPRVDAMLVRLDTLEQHSTIVEDHLVRVDSSLQDMGASMSSQFSEVMKSLANLAELQRGGDGRKRQATQPFPSKADQGSS